MDIQSQFLQIINDINALQINPENWTWPIWYHLNNFLFLKVTYILHALVNRLKIIRKRRYNNEWLYTV